jgi:hypothetical protein
MRRLSIIFVCLLALTGVGRAADVYRWGSITGNKIITPSTYVGPGDVVPGATAYFGLRAYNRAAAVAGTNAAKVRNPNTLETCLVALSPTGGLLGTVSGCSASSSGDTIATFCAESAGYCQVITLYDQTGNGNDISNAPGGSPLLGFSCLHAFACAQTSTSLFLAGITPVAAASSFSMMYTAERTGNTAAVNFVFCDCAASATNAGIGFGTVANTGYIYAGTANVSVPGVADNVVHAVQATFIGFGSSFCWDGTCQGTSPGSNVPDQILQMGRDGNGNDCDCNIFEAGLWPLQFTSTQIANMCANQYNYWGTAVACTPAAPASLLLQDATDNLLLESGGSNVLCLEGAC